MNAFNTRKKKGIISLICFFLLLLLILWGASTWTYKRGIDELADIGNARLELYTNYLQGVLEKYESLPELLAIDSHLVRALLSPHEHKRIETLNKYLETINKVSNTRDTYLMNKDGLTIAASNWNEEHPFIGRNFNYRPYFKQAMKGKLGRYFALGTASSKRGYYFAYPVRKDDRILGAVVIKINIDKVEEKWADHNEHFLVTDPDGVVFITTNQEWRYKTLKPIEKTILDRIKESRRYPDASFASLSESNISDSGETQIIEVASETRKSGFIRVLKQTKFMPQAGWNVHILSDTRSVKQKVLFINILVATGLTLIFFLAVMFNQRQHRLAEIKQIEEDAKNALQEANEHLESRVIDRTQKLTEINMLLRKEILDRKQTEIKLKRTRKELIHAAKLAALGQMSAGINHQLNQPLAAIRSYADNGRQFLIKDRPDEAMWNLEQIGELTERMAQIGMQLKLFSKKSSGQIIAVPVHGVIDGALEILKPILKKSGIELLITIDPEGVEVRGNNILLQQVLVNLITNATQALDGQPDKKIRLECIEKKGNVVIAVQDQGPGVAKEHRNDIFEPFYTTKKSGVGLGLGLTISARIVRDLGGKMILANIPQGARFEFSLKKA